MELPSLINLKSTVSKNIASDYELQSNLIRHRMKQADEYNSSLFCFSRNTDILLTENQEKLCSAVSFFSV